MGFLKTASAEDVCKAASLLSCIYEENPSHWPYGLTVGHFDPGDLFLVYKRASEDPVGFVGWQERNVGFEKLGFYSVGTLPEHRGMGAARTGLSQLLAKKSAGVDRVLALVVDGNVPSEKLANRLGIPVLKSKHAGFMDVVRGAGKVLKHPGTQYGVMIPGTAYGTAAFQDNQMHPDEPWSFSKVLDFAGNDKNRNQTNIMNMILGGMGGSGMVGGGRKFLGMGEGKMVNGRLKLPTPTQRTTNRVVGGTIAGAGFNMATVVPITKDLMMHSHKIPEAFDHISKEIPLLRESIEKVKDVGSAVKSNPGAGLGGAALLSAALLGGGYLAAKSLKQPAPGGRLRVTLPTKNPGDAETSVEMPYDPQTSMTDALRRRIDLDTRRRLYAETRSRVHRRGQKAPDMAVEELVKD